MRPISQIGRDDAFQPYVTDWKMFSDRIVRYFRDQPLVIRKLCRSVETVQFDGVTEHETALLKDIDKPEYAFEPSNMTTMIEGEPVIVKIPQFFFSASLLKEKWKALFAGKARLPILLARMVEKIKIEEDIKGFQGDQRTGLRGLVSDLTTELGPFADPMGDTPNGDGIMSNFQAVIDAAMDHFTAEGVGHLPVDVTMSSYLFNRAKNTIIPYQPGVNNLHIAANKLNGGEIMTTNHVLDGVAADNNTIVFVVRMPDEAPSWQIISSGLEQNMMPQGLWKEEYGIRERFAVKILDGRLIAWADELDSGVTPPEE